MGKLQKMTLVAYSDDKFSKKVSPDGTYTVMLNPERIDWKRSIDYNNQQAPDSSKPDSKYLRTPSETISFDLVIDGTGVVDAKRVDLNAEINKLKKVVYDYDGKIHRPNFITLFWGKGLKFKGVLTSFDTNYTFFRPDGSALRAKVSLSFQSYTDPSSATKMADQQSPDMTHLVDVIEGHTLPGLSEQIFDTPDYYIQLAKFNKLNKFRHLQAGQQLVFPPLSEGADHGE